MGAYDCDCINNLEYDRRERKQKEQPQSTMGQLNDGARSTARSTDLIERQQAIDAINNHFGFNIEEEYGSAVQEVINGLPSAQPATNCSEIPNGSDDTISRRAAIDALQKCRKHCIDPFDSYHIDIQDAENQLSKLPTIQPEPKEGRWINGKCDLCGEHAPFWCMASTYHESNFCPNCGARMKGERQK